MAKAKTLVGLDVHATKIVAAVLDAETGRLQTFGMGGESAKVAAFPKRPCVLDRHSRKPKCPRI